MCSVCMVELQVTVNNMILLHRNAAGAKLIKPSTMKVTSIHVKYPPHFCLNFNYFSVFLQIFFIKAPPPIPNLTEIRRVGEVLIL